MFRDFIVYSALRRQFIRISNFIWIYVYNSLITTWNINSVYYGIYVLHLRLIGFTQTWNIYLDFTQTVSTVYFHIIDIFETNYGIQQTCKTFI